MCRGGSNNLFEFLNDSQAVDKVQVTKTMGNARPTTLLVVKQEKVDADLCCASNTQADTEYIPGVDTQDLIDDDDDDEEQHKAEDGVVVQQSGKKHAARTVREGIIF